MSVDELVVYVLGDATHLLAAPTKRWMMMRRAPRNLSPHGAGKRE